MRDVWRNGRIIVFRDDEARLCSCLDYAIPDLTYMSYLLAVFGGPRNI
jgi:hypothetical protein